MIQIYDFREIIPPFGIFAGKRAAEYARTDVFASEARATTEELTERVRVFFVVEVPIILQLTGDWLEGYAYRVSLSWTLFLFHGRCRDSSYRGQHGPLAVLAGGAHQPCRGAPQVRKALECYNHSLPNKEFNPFTKVTA